MFARLLILMGATVMIMLALPALADTGADEGKLLKAVTFYASFDEEVKGDVGGGELTISTRQGDLKKGAYTFEKGFDKKAFQIAKGRGIAGGTLNAVDVLPKNGRIFFPAKGNIAFDKKGWSGSMSMWIRTDPNKLLKTSFCDPVQITQKGANNGGLWFDFNDKKPRDLRMGVFAAVPEGKKGVSESDKDAPMIRLPKVDFKMLDWHHVVMTWKNLDTGKANAQAALYIDCKKIGELKDRELAMAWDIEKTGIYVAINYLGLLDEFAIFNRELSEEEIALLMKKPGMMAKLKKK